MSCSTRVQVWSHLCSDLWVRPKNPPWFNGAKDWLVEVATDYDVEVMSSLDDFDFSELIKFSTMERDLEAKGFKLEAANGLIASWELHTKMADTSFSTKTCLPSSTLV